MQYYDLTLYELTAMIAGYNVRWEEKWKHTRALYTLFYNVNYKKNKKEFEIMALPSEAEDVAFQKWISSLKTEAEFAESLGVKTEANGSGISS